MGDPLRLAIIGAGAVTQVAHLPVLKRTRTGPSSAASAGRRQYSVKNMPPTQTISDSK